jgi:predicted kinase
MPKLYVLVGVPGSGKSTWVNSQDWASNCAYISTDKFVDAYAHEVNKTYSEVFDYIMPKAVKMMADEVVTARELGQDIIWDQTSTTAGSRRKKFKMLPDYYAIAVVFKTPAMDELNRRLQGRPGKNIPDHVMRNMIDNFEMPSEEEGFKEIWYAE